ncbi:MAG: hypothetical protein Q8Q32_01305 [bacterium]|nr:hypothetical protein [bacterium]
MHKHHAEGAVDEAIDTSPRWLRQWLLIALGMGVLIFLVSLIPSGKKKPDPPEDDKPAQAEVVPEREASRARPIGPRKVRMELDVTPGRVVHSTNFDGKGNALPPVTYMVNGNVVRHDDPLFQQLREFAAPWKPGETSRELVTEMLEPGKWWPPKGYPGIRDPLPNGGVSYTSFGDGSGPDGHFYARVQGTLETYRMAGKGDSFPTAVPYWVKPVDGCKAVHIVVFRHTADGQRHLAQRYRD